jgi:hypothetical protein
MMLEWIDVPVLPGASGAGATGVPYEQVRVIGQRLDRQSLRGSRAVDRRAKVRQSNPTHIRKWYFHG